MKESISRLLLCAGVTLVACVEPVASPESDGVDADTGDVGFQQGALSVEEQNAWSRTGKIGREAIDGLNRAERVRVLVWMNAPASVQGAARRRWIRNTGEDIRGAIGLQDLEVLHRFENVSGLVAEVTAPAVRALLARDDVGRIDMDLADTRGHLAESLPLTRITETQSHGLDGSGTRVAVIDSGIDRDNPAFSGRIIDEACFCGSATTQGCCPDGSIEQLGPGAAEDDERHGTAVTGVAASQPTQDGFGGAAPAAEIIAIKVLNADNRTQSSSDPIEALDWIITNHPEVDVVNMSLGSDAVFAGDCDDASSRNMMYADAVAQLRAGGTLVVASAGNGGNADAMGAPACVADFIAVGASADSDGFGGCGVPPGPGPADDIPCFTNASTTTDVFAPGAVVDSVTLGGGPATSFTGTSFSAPMTAGCVLLLRQFQPLATAAELEAAVEASPRFVTDTRSGRSYPRLHCSSALAQLGGPEPAGCATDVECDDLDPCTQDVCDLQGQCQNTPGLCETESFGTSFGGTLPAEPFEVLPLGAPGVDVEWQPITGPTPSSGTGPAGDHTNPTDEFPTYLYVEASSAGFANADVDGNPDKTAILESPCADLRGRSSASFTFYLHMAGFSQGTLSLEADRGCDGGYELLFEQPGPATGSEFNDYLRRDVDLSSFAGGLVRVRLRAITGDSYSSDIAIDDLFFEIGGGDGEDCNTTGCPDDGQFCTTEVCLAGGSCDSQPTDCAGLVCSESLDACVECLSDSDCPSGSSCDASIGQCVSAPSCEEFTATTQQHIDVGRAVTDVQFFAGQVEARVVGSDELLESRAFFTSFSDTLYTLRTRPDGASGFEIGSCP